MNLYIVLHFSLSEKSPSWALFMLAASYYFLSSVTGAAGWATGAVPLSSERLTAK